MTEIPIDKETLRKRLEICTEECVELFSLDGTMTMCKVLDVYDGDSITVAMPFHDEVKKFKARMACIDTPELRTKCELEKRAAVDAKQFLENLILDRVMFLTCYKFDKYGRVLVRLMDSEGLDINQHMIDSGHAVSYSGGGKISWSDRLSNQS